MNTSQNDYESFLEYLQKGVMLLDLEELDSFHFKIDLENAELKELGNLLLLEGINEDNYVTTIGPKSVNILQRIFTLDKVKELSELLAGVDKKYGDDLEISRMVLASQLFLGDDNAKHYHLPLAITRLMEDIYEAFSDSTTNGRNKS